MKFEVSTIKKDEYNVHFKSASKDLDIKIVLDGSGHWNYESASVPFITDVARVYAIVTSLAEMNKNDLDKDLVVLNRIVHGYVSKIIFNNQQEFLSKERYKITRACDKYLVYSFDDNGIITMSLVVDKEKFDFWKNGLTEDIPFEDVATCGDKRVFEIKIGE